MSASKHMLAELLGLKEERDAALAERDEWKSALLDWGSSPEGIRDELIAAQSGWDVAKAEAAANAALCARLHEALLESLNTIECFHGEPGWDTYIEHAPEMKRLKVALALTPSAALDPLISALKAVPSIDHPCVAMINKALAGIGAQS